VRRAERFERSRFLPLIIPVVVALLPEGIVVVVVVQRGIVVVPIVIPLGILARLETDVVTAGTGVLLALVTKGA